jgi:hypothetical protein
LGGMRMMPFEVHKKLLNIQMEPLQ